MDSTAIELEPGTSAEESVAVILTEVNIDFPFIKKECSEFISENNSGEVSTTEHSYPEGITIKVEPGTEETGIELSDIYKETLKHSQSIIQTAGGINADIAIIKTEPGPREEGEVGIPFAEYDIGLPVVNTDFVERRTQTAESLTDPKKHSTQKRLSCPHCNYSCDHKSKLDAHLRIHTGEKPFSCSDCNYSCSQRGILTRHMRAHSGEKPFSCPECNFSFSRQGHLTTHMMTHGGKKLFSCSVCNFSCSQKGNLTRHMLTHSGEKPFSCPVCNYSCSRKGYLKFHILQIHSTE